jgi:hypothetical protein
VRLQIRNNYSRRSQWRHDLRIVSVVLCGPKSNCEQRLTTSSYFYPVRCARLPSARARLNKRASAQECGRGDANCEQASDARDRYRMTETPMRGGSNFSARPEVARKDSDNGSKIWDSERCVLSIRPFRDWSMRRRVYGVVPKSGDRRMRFLNRASERNGSSAGSVFHQLTKIERWRKSSSSNSSARVLSPRPK